MILLESNQNHATAKDTEICTTLSASMGMGGGYVPMVVLNRRLSDVRISTEDISPTIEGGTGDGGNNLPMLVDTLVFDESQITSPINGNHPNWNDHCHTLSREAGRTDIIIRGERTLSDNKAEPCCWDGSQTAPTLTARNAGGGQRMPDKDNFNAVMEPTCYGLDRASYNQGKNAQYDFSVEEEKIGAQVAKGPGAVATSVVRRLIPEECEALQGYSYGWTLIGKPEEVEVKDYDIEYDDDGNEVSKTFVGTHTEIAYFYTDRNGKKKRCADSSRYKAIGNSIAIGYANNQSGFWMWLLKRISAQYERSATLGSLFDGIGGFPLGWEFYNGKGSAVWASEIEDFCIEVTRRRFPDPDDPAID